MLRVLLLFSVIGVFAFGNGFAMNAELFPLSASPSKKRKIDFSDHATPPKKPKVETVPIFSPHLKRSPVSTEREAWRGVREKMATEGYSQLANELRQQPNPEKYLKGHKRKNPVPSPEARNIFRGLPKNYWSRNIIFNEKHVYQADFLFDPYAEFWTKDGLKTNLELMKEGHAPLIQRGDKYYGIELHHLTQNDTNTKYDPIVEVTSRCHMGQEDRMIFEVDPVTGELRLVHSGLTKEEALKLCEPGQITVTNALHFRKGKSLINRDEFDAWRKDYWMNRAEEIEKGNFVDKENLPAFVTPIELFTSPVKAKPLGSTVKRKLSFDSSTSPVKKRKL